MTDLEKWIYTVDQVKDAYILTRDDYTNDLCIRDAIDEKVLNTTDKKLLKGADKAFKANTIRTENPHFATKKNWWWFRIPKRIGKRMKEDLILTGNDTSQLVIIDELKIK